MKKSAETFPLKAARSYKWNRAIRNNRLLIPEPNSGGRGGERAQRVISRPLA